MLSSSGELSAKDLWVAPTHVLGPGVDTFPWPTTGTGQAIFAFAVPADFAAFTSASITVVSHTDFAGTFNVYGSVRRGGETAAGALLLDVGVPAALAAGTIEEIDITPLLSGQFDPSSAGSDYVSVFFFFPSSPALEQGNVLGMRFVFDAVPLTGAEIANDSIASDQVLDQSLTGSDILDASIGAADVRLTQIQARVNGTCPSGQGIRAIGIGGTVTCEPMEPPATDFVLWVNPLSMIPDEDGSGQSSLLLSRAASGTTLRVTTEAAGDLQWLALPLALDSRYAIKKVTLCYALENASSFISQVRLTEETLPPTAPVVHDDGTDRTSVVPVCVDSPVGNREVDGSMTLLLRLNFASTTHHIDIGAIGITLGE